MDSAGSGPGVPPDLVAVLEEARALDLLGPMDLETQIAHASGFAAAYEAACDPVGAGQAPREGEIPPGMGPSRWMDLGSGGGLPGLVLAQLWPRSGGILLDSAQRRAAFLSEAVHTLGWEGRVEVMRARAEYAATSPNLRGTFGAVWARSFGSPPVTAECAAPFLSVGGVLIVSEPPSPDIAPGPGAADPALRRWPREGLAPLGLEPVVTVRSRFGYQVLRQARPCPERFPRRAGVAGKRPLYRVVDP